MGLDGKDGGNTKEGLKVSSQFADFDQSPKGVRLCAEWRLRGYGIEWLNMLDREEG